MTTRNAGSEMKDVNFEIVLVLCFFPSRWQNDFFFLGGGTYKKKLK